jgi:hypothetical protein
MTRSCSACNQGGLHWQLRGGKWRLADADRKLHECAQYSDAKQQGRITPSAGGYMDGKYDHDDMGEVCPTEEDMGLGMYGD